MKFKTTIAALSLLITVASVSNAAVLAIGNIGTLTSDTIYADKNNALMSGTGLVTIGYFNSALITIANVDTIQELHANLGNFIVVSTSIPGTAMAALGDLAVAGYADNTANPTGAIGGTGPASTGQLTTGNALIGRNYFSIITSATSLAAAALAPVGDTQFALVLLGQLPNEDLGEGSLVSTPTSGPVGTVGTLGTFNGDLGFGPGTYVTLKMSQVPEPSAALLGAIGVLGLLRRRRI